jgi:salicylate hydroxylase
MSEKIHVLIAGGGIGGLAAALALLRKGFDVDLYEQAEELKEVGAGVQISPNGNRALHALGVFETLRTLSCNTEAKEIRLWNTGQTWKLFDLGAEAVERYGFPYITVYRPDLLQVLAEAVRREKADAIHLGRRCTGLFEHDAKVTLALDGGEKVVGDVLIGADGVHSVVRAALFGVDRPKFSGMIAWRGTIPMDNLPKKFARSVATNWVGPGGHVVHYPLRAGKLMNFVGVVERGDWQVESWSTRGTSEECAGDFRGWHEDIHVLIGHAPSLFKWALMGRDPLDHWTMGRVTLLGDACHPTLPYLAQGAVMAIEDAVVLGRCMEKYRDDVATALTRYEQARIDITRRKVLGASSNTTRFHNRALADPAQAQAYVDREWSREAILQRYEWVFTDDVTTTPV